MCCEGMPRPHRQLRRRVPARPKTPGRWTCDRRSPHAWRCSSRPTCRPRRHRAAARCQGVAESWRQRTCGQELQVPHAIAGDGIRISRHSGRGTRKRACRGRLVEFLVVALLEVDDRAVARSADLDHWKTVDGRVRERHQPVEEARRRHCQADAGAPGEIARGGDLPRASPRSGAGPPVRPGRTETLGMPGCRLSVRPTAHGRQNRSYDLVLCHERRTLV